MRSTRSPRTRLSPSADGVAARRCARSVTSSTGPVASMPTDALPRRSDQRRGLLGVDLQPVPTSRPVVVALEQLAAAASQTSSVVVGRTRRARSGRTAAGAPAGQPADHLVVVDRRARAPRRAASPARRASRRALGLRRRCAGSRRAGSPSRRPARPSRSRTIALVTSSGTRSPRVHVLLGLQAERRCRRLTLARKMSPVEIFGMPTVLGDELRPGSPCPPRGADAGRAALPQEPFVVALLQLALDLLHGVQADADHDQDAGAAEREVLVRRRPARARQSGSTAMTAQVERAGQR